MTQFKTHFPEVDSKWAGDTDTFQSFYDIVHAILSNEYGSKYKKSLPVN